MDIINHMLGMKKTILNDPKDKPWVILHNGKAVERCGSHAEALDRLTSLQPHSIWEATRKDGWKIVNEARSNAFDVYLNGKLIDTVFDDRDDPNEVKRSLIDHDGYDPGIMVKKSNKTYGGRSNEGRVPDDKDAEPTKIKKLTEWSNKEIIDLLNEYDIIDLRVIG